MRTRSYRMIVVLLLAGATLLAACNQTPPESLETAVPIPPANTTPVTPAATPAVTIVPQATLEFDPAATITPTQSSLIVWVPPEFMNINEVGRDLFTDQLLAFDATHPDTTVVLAQKNIAGQGGILSYLRTGRTVAPGILPDLIVIPGDQVTLAATENLIFHLDDLVPADATDDWFPASRQMAQINDQLMVYPFALTNLPHLVYDTTVVTGTLSTTWSSLFDSPTRTFLFPAAGRQGAILTLQLYLAAGGTLTNDAGQAALQREPLTQALELLSNGRNNGTILLQSSNFATLDETWQLFQTGNAAINLTNSSHFLQQRTADQTYGVAAIPGINGPLTPMVNGWAWAITSPDPVRQALAAELLMLLIEPSYLSSWTAAANMLPAQEGALAAWPAEDPYTAFARQELARAQFNTVNATSNIMLTLGNAVFDVISLSKSPSVAAEEAILSLQP